MDVEMADLDGISAVRTGKILYPEVRFLMLTVFDDEDKIFEAIKAGADGYILKSEKAAVIIECIVQLDESGTAPMSPRIARKTLDLLMNASIPKKDKEEKDKFNYALSERETEVLKLTIDGYSYKQIAQKIFLSTNTVKKHLPWVILKVDCNPTLSMPMEEITGARRTMAITDWQMDHKISFPVFHGQAMAVLNIYIGTLMPITSP
jgi:DNA-binding NarL/FixJ family response regulator